MRNPYILSAGAGIVAAFALLVSAAVFPPLIIIAGLSIYLVGLVWGYAAAMLAAATGVLALSVLPHDAHIVLGLGLGLPAVLVTAVVDAVRTRLPPDAQTGWIVLAAAGFGGLVSALAMTSLEPQMDTLRQELTKSIEQSYAMSGQTPPGTEELKSITDRVVAYLPSTLAIMAMGFPLLNLWLAGRIARSAGLLRQAWPDLAALRLPTGTALVLGLALLALTLLSGTASVAATSISAALLFGYLLVGLAVVHYVSRGKSWRTVALVATYISLIWLALPILIVGLIDAIYPLRGRPPSTPSDNAT